MRGFRHVGWANEARRPHRDRLAGAPLIYRVWFEGPELDERALAALSAAGAVWEGTEGFVAPGAEWRHSARLRAADASAAARQIETLLAEHSAYRATNIELLLGAGGEPWRGEIDRRWEQVDWSVPELSVLSPLQRTVIWALLDDHEPTWVILRALEATPDPAEVDDALREMGALGLVHHRLARSMAPDEEGDQPVPWWALSDHAWDLLGLIKSPRY
jgi:hypothetical protein